LNSSTNNPFSTARRALLITYPYRFEKKEAEDLSRAACYDVVKIISQRYLSKSRFGIGVGKAEKLKEILDDNKANYIIFDTHLKTTQIYNLAKLTGREIIDRERLILEIFSRRARTAEAKLQVELAELTYEMPRAKERVRLAKSSEQPGFFGLGKYEVDVYTRALKKRISSKRLKLQRAAKRRELHRIKRRKLDIPILSLSGYTGVGKTTLFNKLSKESNQTSGDYFTTLTTSTSSLNIDGFKVLISDTVGFISRLPTYMIEAFKSTLEELTYSSQVLLLVDASQSLENLQNRYHSCIEILAELGVSPARVFIVFNKTELIDQTQLNKRKDLLGVVEENSCSISAKTGQGINDLLKKIRERILDNVEAKIRIKEEIVPYMSQQIDWLKEYGSLEIKKSTDGALILEIKANAWIIDKFRRIMEAYEGN
jgi:GTP-binding protein HflX